MLQSFLFIFSPNLLGRLVACGRPSKSFNPFMLPRDRKHIKTNIQELQNNLMVDFDPVRCFVNEIEVSTGTNLIWLRRPILLMGNTSYWNNFSSRVCAERISWHVQSMVWLLGWRCYWSYMGQRKSQGMCFSLESKINLDVQLLIKACQIFFSYLIFLHLCRSVNVTQQERTTKSLLMY